MMSFSKAKLKRFNDITDFSSPFSKEKDKDKEKEKEKSKKHEDKEKDKKSELFLDEHAIPSSDKKSSKLRLFRTPSLPYRLKFRQISDLTPSKASKKDAAATLLAPSSSVAPITPHTASIFRKCEKSVLEKKSRDEKYIEKLRGDIEKLNQQIQSLIQTNSEKSTEIQQLKFELEGLEKAVKFLEDIAHQSIGKVHQSEEETKDILKEYDSLLLSFEKIYFENENLIALVDTLKKSQEMLKIQKSKEIAQWEKKLQLKTSECQKMKTTLSEKLNVIKNFEFELGKKTFENFEISNRLEKTEEHMKISEVQHEENLKMLKNSYENEIFFLNNQLSKVQNQLLKVNKSQKKISHQQFDFVESQIDLENQKTKFEMEKRNYEVTLKNYSNIIEILSMRLKKSDTDVETLMAENTDLKAEVIELKTNYEKLKNSAENLKKNFDEKNSLMEKLMQSSESEMINMVSKMNDFFNEKFFEISELKKSFEIRDKNLKKMTSTILEEFAIGIELAKIELDEKQKRLLEMENENKTIKLENLQIKMKLNEFERSAEISAKEQTKEQKDEDEAGTTDDEKKKIQEKEEENVKLKEKLKEFDQKFCEIELASIETERKYKQILEQQKIDSEKLKCFDKLKESNSELRMKIQKLQDNIQIFDSPTKTTPKKAIMLFGKENQSPIFGHSGRAAFEHSPKNILKPRN